MTTPKSKTAKTTGAAGRRPPARASDQTLEPGLYVVATPIGNLRDITLRAIDILKRADLVLAEDTRVTRKLLSAHGISARVEPYHEHNAVEAGARALERLEEGAAIALVSDAGTPLVSDPGERLVGAAIAAGHRVIPIPGASALLAAVSAAGLPGGRFMFAGFPPPKTKARREDFEALAAVPASLVFFESGPRLAESLADMAAVFGARDAVIGRELTKMFEEFRRGPLPDLAQAAALGDPPKGEIVIVVGAPAKLVGLSEADIETGCADAELRNALARLPLREAAQEVAAALDAPRRPLYQRALILKANR